MWIHFKSVLIFIFVEIFEPGVYSGKKFFRVDCFNDWVP